ncbi:MAG: glutaredoxin 3 [Marinosulfonomonas sp.]|nr:glutaredoxin 3 [Marinosulfonomonas sp.]
MQSVEIYTAPFCGFCVAAKRLLKKKGVKISETDVMMHPSKRQEMMARAHGGQSVPQIFIGDLHVGGCDELYALDRAGKLDALLEG